MARYDREKYPRAWRVLREHLERFGQERISGVVVDNAASEVSEDAPLSEVSLPERATSGPSGFDDTRIAGSNAAWEFSAFDEGIDHLAATGRLHDVVLLTTDAFRANGDGYLDLIDARTIDLVRERRAVVGWYDSFGEELELLGRRYRGWLRTSYLICPASLLPRLGRFGDGIERRRFFSGDWRSPWAADAPLSRALASRLERWLVRPAAAGASPDIAVGEQWHSAFELSEATLRRFEDKATAILREHRLSTKLEELGVDTFDMRVVARGRFEGRSLGESHRGWEGFESHSVAARSSDKAGDEGNLLYFRFGGADSTDAAATQHDVLSGFLGDVLPLVRQRYPSAALGLDREADAALLAALGGSDGVMEIPSGGDSVAAAGCLVGMDRRPPEWASGSGIPIVRLKAAPSGAEAVAAAGRCCDLLEQRVAERVAEEAPECDPLALLETVPFARLEPFRAWRAERRGEYLRRREIEVGLAEGRVPFLVDAVCVFCASRTPMHVDFEFGGDVEAGRPNWRERLVCQRCALNCKARGLLQVLLSVVAPGKDDTMAVWELEDEVGHALRDRFTSVTSWQPEPGDEDGRFRSAAEPTEVLVVIDMLDRAPDCGAAIDACFARLAPGGTMVFTGSFWTDRQENRKRIGGRTTGVYREFGWELLDQVRAAGFHKVEAHLFWSLELGYLGTDQVVFVAHKSGRR